MYRPTWPAIVSDFGASNLNQWAPFDLNIRVPALEALLGGPPGERTELARSASPVFHVDATDPPLLLLHGDQNPQIPINQSHESHGAYKAQGLPAHFEVVHRARHGAAPFFDAERTELVRAFLDKHLRASREPEAARRKQAGRYSSAPVSSPGAPVLRDPMNNLEPSGRIKSRPFAI